MKVNINILMIKYEEKYIIKWPSTKSCKNTDKFELELL